MPPVQTITNDEGDEIELPTQWAICDTCSGEGHNSLHIDGHGLSSEELAEWDPEERETYFRGGYDQTCRECAGTGKVAIVDTDKLTPDQAKLWIAWVEDEREYRALEAMERRMGC